MMYVAHQKNSDPPWYVASIRGTNAVDLWDWFREDAAVLEEVDWPLPPGKTGVGRPKISQGTNTGLEILKQMRPIEGMPGAGHDINSYLTGITPLDQAKITFTGHSLGGALAPTLALWFKQSNREWLSQHNVTVSTIPFAGPTAGNKDFAAYSDAEFGDACTRIHNRLDIVPHVWNKDAYHKLPDLYKSGHIEMSLVDKVIYKAAHVIVSIKDYRQINMAKSFSRGVKRFTSFFNIEPYMKQARYQHTHAYLEEFGVPALSTFVHDCGTDVAKTL